MRYGGQDRTGQDRTGQDRTVSFVWSLKLLPFARWLQGWSINIFLQPKITAATNNPV